jgi:alkylated DNA repair dioxygenase AlkB
MRAPVFVPSGHPGELLPLEDAEVRYWVAAFDEAEAAELFSLLRGGIDWRTEDVLILGERRRVPRLVAWHGDPGASYVYSGTPHEPKPWTPALARVRSRVSSLTGVEFNAVLLNLYRDGRDGMGWHADDEPELGAEPVIASVSFGAPRRFCLRHRRRKLERLDVSLAPGSLLLMSGPTQRHWLHALPKTARPTAERINLTFRQVQAGD